MSDDDRANPLGSYLRARRALVTAEQAGSPSADDDGAAGRGEAPGELETDS